MSGIIEVNDDLLMASVYCMCIEFYCMNTVMFSDKIKNLIFCMATQCRCFSNGNIAETQLYKYKTTLVGTAVRQLEK